MQIRCFKPVKSPIVTSTTAYCQALETCISSPSLESRGSDDHTTGRHGRLADRGLATSLARISNLAVSAWMRDSPKPAILSGRRAIKGQRGPRLCGFSTETSSGVGTEGARSGSSRSPSAGA
jgi:hypothetical protein